MLTFTKRGDERKREGFSYCHIVLKHRLLSRKTRKEEEDVYNWCLLKGQKQLVLYLKSFVLYLKLRNTR